MNAREMKPTAHEMDLSPQALLIGLATNLYLTALVLALSNRLVASSDTALITAIARVAPPEMEAPVSLAVELAKLGVDASTAMLCTSILELQARAQRELEFPSGPHRLFRPARNSYVSLQRLWQAAAEDSLRVASSVLASRLPSSLARERLCAAHAKLGAAIDGSLVPTADEMAGVLPVWVRRRRHARHAISLPVTIWGRDRRERGQVLDVSQGGALVVLRGASSRGDKLQIEFPGRAPITAIVQWRLDTRMGVKFLDPLHPTDPLLNAAKLKTSAH